MDPFLFLVLLYVGGFRISLLILWFVIHTAVRAALTSHRQAMADERRPTPRYVAQ